MRLHREKTPSSEAEWRRRERDGPPAMSLRSLPFILGIFFVGILESFVGLIVSGPHLTIGLRKLGASVSRFSAIRGRYRAHYRELHGN